MAGGVRPDGTDPPVDNKGQDTELPDEAAESEDEDQDKENDEDGEDSPSADRDDMRLAWEMLEVAKVIYNKQPSPPATELAGPPAWPSSPSPSEPFSRCHLFFE